MSTPKVSVIVPHFNDLENLGRCLDALQRQTVPAAQREIIVADNNSPIARGVLESVIAGRARLEVVRERGAGPARNGGVAAARGQWLAFTDSDCVPEPNWITEGLAALAEFDIVGGRVKVSVQDERAVSPTEAFEKLFAFDFESYIRDKGFTGSGNMFVSRKTFDAVGGFGSGVSEDVDWSHRATAMGYRLGYAPAAVVSHPARRDWVELRTKWSRINRESYALQARTRAGRVRWLLRALLLPASAVAHSPRVLNPRNGLPVTDRIKALGMLYRVRTWRLFDAIRVAVGR